LAHGHRPKGTPEPAIDPPLKGCALPCGEISEAMAAEDPKGRKPINIELPEDQAFGVYANLAVITHSPVEFVVDFAQMAPGLAKAQVRSRVILAPHHAKRLMRALTENVQRYESQHGVIKEITGQSNDPAMPLTFSGPQGEA
jgi:hypothetical protein